MVVTKDSTEELVGFKISSELRAQMQARIDARPDLYRNTSDFCRTAVIQLLKGGCVQEVKDGIIKDKIKTRENAVREWWTTDDGKKYKVISDMSGDLIIQIRNEGGNPEKDLKVKNFLLELELLQKKRDDFVKIRTNEVV